MANEGHVAAGVKANLIALFVIFLIVVIFFTDWIIYGKYDPCIIMNTWERKLIMTLILTTISGVLYYTRKQLKKYS